MRPRFVLIDHSLQNLGGHHYPYAYSVLQAAQRAGWQPVLATHRRFRDHSALPPDWQILPLFRYPSYLREAFGILAQPRATTAGARSWWRGAKAWVAARARTRRVNAFAAGCSALLAAVTPDEHDLLFIGTCSELDLGGLGALLQRDAAACKLDWHLQFHFGFLRGREPDYASQGEAAARMRRVFADALRPLAGCRVHCYCTTEQLTAQYDRLEVGPFYTLTYPVHELFNEAHAVATPGTAARIACLGHSRREKGYGQLTRLLRELWTPWLGPGRAQMVLQTHHRRQRRSLQRVVARLAAATGGQGTALQFGDFPLPLKKYAQLLRSADIGLLLYEGERYYARCSGVLLELLVAGVPVLAPAGCWIAEQINEPNQQHLERVARQAEAHAAPLTIQVTSSAETPPGDSRHANFTAQPGIIHCEVDADTTALLLEFHWLEPSEPGTYLRLALEQCEPAITTTALARTILGPRSGGQIVRALLHVPPASTWIRVRCSNAWATGVVSLAELRCLALRGAPPPLGAVGLTFADNAQVAELLGELLTHLDHYQGCARSFAREFAPRQSAERVVAALAAHVRETCAPLPAKPNQPGPEAVCGQTRQPPTQPLRTTLIITTYNWREALDLTLRSVHRQLIMPDEIIVADDGSTADTAELVQQWSQRFTVPLRHIWQEDLGFRLARSRNRAIAASVGEYLIIVDGDMSLHPSFIADHCRAARHGFFIQGVRLLTGPKAARRMLAENVLDLGFFSANVRRRRHTIRNQLLSGLFFRRTYTSQKAIRGSNQAYWKSDLLRVNGFDEQMVGWGREDNEIAARLYNIGVKRRNLKFAALATHLYHRTRNPLGENPNDLILRTTIEQHRTWCRLGIDQHLVAPK